MDASSFEAVDFNKIVPPPGAQKRFEEYEANRAREKAKLDARKIDEVAGTFFLGDRDTQRLREGSLSDTKARDACRVWWTTSKASRPCLVLLGGTGIGKTLAAAEIAVAADHYKYVESKDLAELSRQSFGPAREEYSSLLLTQSLLIVDEVGMEPHQESATTAIHDVVNRRKSAKRPTILISNLGQKDFTERFDARTIDRLRDYGFMKAIPGGSLRGRQP